MIKLRFTCPFCFRKYSMGKVKYICTSCKEPTKPKFFENEPVICRVCEKEAVTRVCPLCNKEIPEISLETPNLPFCIVGVTASGKTNYITVMLKELSKFSGLSLPIEEHNTADTRNQQDVNQDRI